MLFRFKVLHPITGKEVGILEIRGGKLTDAYVEARAVIDGYFKLEVI